MGALIEPGHITGLVLAGGRGSRLGGVDKGLQEHLGRPLALHVLRRLEPQVGNVAVNANRHLDAYEAMGAPVWTDTLADHPGPLAGILAGLVHCATPWLATVPCDCPHFPLDLVHRLASAFDDDDAAIEIAMAATNTVDGARAEPVFALMRSGLRASLEAFLLGGERKVERWAAQHRCALVVFADATAFFNVNTPDDLQALRAGR